MAATKHQYELTYIVSGMLNDDQTRKIIDGINKFVEDNGGEIIDVDEWGSRRLAFRIDRKRTGFYVNMYLRAPVTLIPRLERNMQINDDVLRYLTLRMDAKMIRHYERQQGKRAEAEQEEGESA